MKTLSPCPLTVLELGTVPYAEALELQNRLAAERARGLRPDTLLLLEHPHVVTRGRGCGRYTVGNTPHPIFDVERGGDVTYHGPGQLVGYPIVHLRERGLLVGPYIRGIEVALIDASSRFGIEAGRIRGFTGVWVGVGCSGRKLASIGIAVRSWVSYHGFALNVSTDLSQFDGVYPCGLEPGRMTSMQRILGSAPDAAEVRSEVSSAFERFLDKACREHAQL